MPNFIGVSNNRAKDMSVVREGNERVLRARLYDAAFFWKEDQKKSLDAHAEELKNVTYQEKLGTVYDKVQRIKKLTLWLAETLKADVDMAKLSRACDLAKADLVTNMVYEFSDVQGIMGREYARKAGEPEEVALAIYEQYLPRYAGDELPSQMGGALLGIGERLDTPLRHLQDRHGADLVAGSLRTAPRRENHQRAHLGPLARHRPRRSPRHAAELLEMPAGCASRSSRPSSRSASRFSSARRAQPRSRSARRADCAVAPAPALPPRRSPHEGPPASRGSRSSSPPPSA